MGDKESILKFLRKGGGKLKIDKAFRGAKEAVFSLEVNRKVVALLTSTHLLQLADEIRALAGEEGADG